jgi:hypothetical protein
LPEQLVLVQDLLWLKQNKLNKFEKMTMISNSSFEQQLDNSLSVSHNLLQRIDPQINQIAIFCKKKLLNGEGRDADRGSQLQALPLSLQIL